MNEREELIQKCLVAYWGTEKTAKFYGSVKGMEAALAVFEEAHTRADGA